MASKQTKRERRDMAKKERLEHMRRAARKRRVRKLTSLLTAAVVIAAVVGLVMWNNNRTAASREKANANLNEAAVAVGCDKAKDFPDERTPNQSHVVAPKKVDYGTNPPTSGDHYNDPNAPAGTGVSASPIQNEAQVHNLEHGHIGIQYTEALPEKVRAELEKFTIDNRQWTFMAPKSDLPVVLAFSAWRNSLSCKTVPDEPAKILKVAKAFYDRFKDKAVESIPGR